MSAATDKARFFLEKSIPELKEYEQKKLFSKVFLSYRGSCRESHIQKFCSANRKKK